MTTIFISGYNKLQNLQEFTSHEPKGLIFFKKSDMIMKKKNSNFSKLSSLPPSPSKNKKHLSLRRVLKTVTSSYINVRVIIFTDLPILDSHTDVFVSLWSYDLIGRTEKLDFSHLCFTLSYWHTTTFSVSNSSCPSSSLTSSSLLRGS